MKTLPVIVLLCMVWLISPIISYGEPQTQQQQQTIDQEELIKKQVGLIDWEHIQELENNLKTNIPHMAQFSLFDEVMHLIKGEKTYHLGDLMRLLVKMILGDFRTYLEIITRFMLIVLMCSLLQVLTNAFKSKEIAQYAYIVCYLLIIYTISHSLVFIVELATQTIDQVSRIMFATLPTLLGFMAVSGYMTSSSALATVIMGGFNGATFIIQTIALPLVVGLIILQIISTMSEEIKVDKWVKLIYKGVGLSLKGIMIGSIAIMGIYKLTLPYVDVAVKRSVLHLSTSFIPIVGDVSRGAIDFILACSHLVKNGFAVGVMIWIVVLVSVPLMQLFAYVFLYHVAAAVIQPIGSKKMSDIATLLAKGCEFILGCTVVVALLAIIGMIICASVGSSIL